MMLKSQYEKNKAYLPDGTPNWKYRALYWRMVAEQKQQQLNKAWAISTEQIAKLESILQAD